MHSHEHVWYIYLMMNVNMFVWMSCSWCVDAVTCLFGSCHVCVFAMYTCYHDLFAALDEIIWYVCLSMLGLWCDEMSW